MGYARKDVEKTKKLAKKFVRYQEGAELYSIGLTKEAKAVYKIDKVALVNCEIFEKFGFDEVFGRSAVMEILELKGSGASKLLSNLVQADIIEPVSGYGKGKYKFKNYP